MAARLPAVAVLAGLALAICAAPAHAAGLGEGLSPAVLGFDFPSVKSIVEDVVRFFFSTLLDALVPNWMKDATVEVLKRLVRVPNPTDATTWPTLTRLSEAMKWIAIPLLSLAAVASWTQHWISELTGRPASFEQSVVRTALAAVLLVVYPVFMSNGVALVNSVTNAMLSVPIAADGLERTVGLIFAGSLVTGSTVLLAVLGIAAVMLITGLFMLSVGLVVITGLLYVSAPLAIVCSVVDETRGIWHAWRYALLTTVALPIGWCVLFTTAGAFVVDMTNWSGGISGQLGERFVGVIAAIVIVYLAVRWPLMLWGAIRAQLAGALLTVGAQRVAVAGAVTGRAGGGRAARTALQRTAVQFADGVKAPVGAVRRSLAGSARFAGAAGAAVAARVPGVAQAAEATATTMKPIAASAAASRPAHAVGRAVRETQGRARAAERAAVGRLAAGGTAAEVVNAAVRAGSRPVQAPSGRGGSRAASAASRSGRGNSRTSTAGAAGRASSAGGRSRHSTSAPPPSSGARGSAPRAKRVSEPSRERGTRPSTLNRTRHLARADRPDAEQTPPRSREIPTAPSPGPRPAGPAPAAPRARSDASPSRTAPPARPSTPVPAEGRGPSAVPNQPTTPRTRTTAAPRRPTRPTPRGT